jgi:hypothetical protein
MLMDMRFQLVTEFNECLQLVSTNNYNTFPKLHTLYKPLLWTLSLLYLHYSSPDSSNLTMQLVNLDW